MRLYVINNVKYLFNIKSKSCTKNYRYLLRLLMIELDLFAVIPTSYFVYCVLKIKICI